MTREKEAVDVYLETIARLEPDIAMIDASAFYASAAISLKRIADIMEKKSDDKLRASLVRAIHLRLDIREDVAQQVANIAFDLWKGIVSL